MPSHKSFALLALLSALGLAAAASLLLVPFETLVPTVGRPSLATRLLVAVPSLALVFVSAVVGCVLASKTGLRAPVLQALIDRRPWWPFVIGALPSVYIVAVAVSCLTILIDVVGLSPSVGRPPFASASLHGEMPLVTRVFYGGVAQEIVLRWGALSLAVLSLRWLFGVDEVDDTVRWAALLSSALVLGLCFSLAVPDAPGPNLASAAGQTVCFGAFCAVLGWLALRHGLEAAVASHVLGVLVAFLLGH